MYGDFSCSFPYRMEVSKSIPHVSWAKLPCCTMGKSAHRNEILICSDNYIGSQSRFKVSIVQYQFRLSLTPLFRTRVCLYISKLRGKHGQINFCVPGGKKLCRRREQVACFAVDRASNQPLASQSFPPLMCGPLSTLDHS